MNLASLGAARKAHQPLENPIKPTYSRLLFEKEVLSYAAFLRLEKQKKITYGLLAKSLGRFNRRKVYRALYSVGVDIDKFGYGIMSSV